MRYTTLAVGVIVVVFSVFSTWAVASADVEVRASCLDEKQGKAVGPFCELLFDQGTIQNFSSTVILDANAMPNVRRVSVNLRDLSSGLLLELSVDAESSFVLDPLLGKIRECLALLNIGKLKRMSIDFRLGGVLAGCWQ